MLALGVIKKTTHGALICCASDTAVYAKQWFWAQSHAVSAVDVMRKLDVSLMPRRHDCGSSEYAAPESSMPRYASAGS